MGDPETGTDCGAAGTGDGDDDDSDDAIDDGCPSMLYVYDALNRLESETDALGRITSYEYDDAGNLIERTDARGLVTSYEYDALNLLTLVEHWDGETLVDEVDYTYDDVGNRLTMADDTGTTEYEYDALNRLTIVTFPGDETVSYQYDDLPGGSAADYPGVLTVLTYPDTKEVEYTYDGARNLETVTDWLDNTTTYTYDDAGNLTDTDLPNGVNTSYTYDDGGRLESVTNVGPGPTTISSFDYTLGTVGNRVEMEDLDGTHTYEYDPLYRLTEVTYPDQDTDTYTYDGVGNRLTKNTDDYTYDAADQLTDLEGTSFGYDDNGNQTSRGNDTFEYDHENRLVESVTDSVTSTSVYNGDGLRMSHTVGQTTTDYIWDVASGLPLILQDGANTYVYGLDLISATDGEGVQTYYQYDGLGSVTDVTDDEGDAVDGYTYDVFGAIRSQSGASDNYWLYTGEQRDGDEGLYYLHARYYDPESGRFLGRDPMRSGNLYAYVGNSPVDYIDPMGTCRIEVRAYSVIAYPGFMGNIRGAYHTFIYTYDPIDKSEVGYRGGPSDLHGVDYIKNLFGSRSSENCVVAKTGVWEKGKFADYGRGGPKTTIYEDDDSCRKWRQSFKETMVRINAARIPYGLLGNNSNSVVREMLENAGLEPSLPGVRCDLPGISGAIASLFIGNKCEINAPGWERNLLR